MKKLFSVVLLAFLAVTMAAEYETEEEVLVLKESNFEDALKEFQHVLVEFYAPWCGHCKKLAPEYARAAQVLKAEGSQVKLAKVDATTEPGVAGKFEVRGYPTLKFFINGNPIAYEGGRTEGEIVNWLRKKTQPSTKNIDSVEEFETTIKNNDVVAVFWGDEKHPKWTAFELASKAFDDVIFVYTTNEDIKQKHDADSDDEVTLFRTFDERVIDFDGELEHEKLTNFIKDHQFPTVMGFDQKIAQKIFSESTPALFLIVQNDEAGQRASDALRTIAPKLKGKWYLSISNIDEGLGGRLAEFVGIKREELPAVRVLHPVPGGNPKKYSFTQEITPENIYEFFEAFTSGRLSPYMKSEPIPEKQEEAVKVVVGHSFKDIVLNDEDDVLVEFYAPWCGHCKSLAPEYLKAAEELKDVKGVVLAKVDSTANEIEGVSIQGYPTIKFYPAHHKDHPIDFDGERNAEGIVKWLKEHATHADWSAKEAQVNEDL